MRIYNAESTACGIKTRVICELNSRGIAELKNNLLARSVAGNRARDAVERLWGECEIDFGFLAGSDGDGSSRSKFGSNRVVDQRNTLRAGLRQLRGESQRIPAGAGGKKIVAGRQFGKAEASVFVGFGPGPLLPCFPAALQTLHEQRDRESFDRFAILLTDSPVDDTFRNQLEDHGRTVGSGGCQMLTSGIRLKIIFGEETWFSHGDRALSGGKAVKLKFSIRPREQGTLSMEINLDERTPNGFGGERIDHRSAQGVFVVVRMPWRFERNALLKPLRQGADSERRGGLEVRHSRQTGGEQHEEGSSGHHNERLCQLRKIPR